VNTAARDAALPALNLALALATRLQEVGPREPRALPAQITHIIALKALTTLGYSVASFHEP